MPIYAANLVKDPPQLRVSRLWRAFVLADRVISFFGLRLPPRVVAWFAGHSVKIKTSKGWRVVPIPVDEVLSSCVQER